MTPLAWPTILGGMASATNEPPSTFSTTEVLLEADEASFTRLRKRRWTTAILTCLVSGAIASAILVIDYRLMLLSLIVLALPAIVVADALMVSRAAAAGLACQVRLAGDEVLLNAGTRLRVADLIRLRVQLDALIFVERRPGERARGHLVPLSGEAWRPVVERLEPLGVEVLHEKAIIPGLLQVLTSVLLVVGLGMVAVVLVAAGLGAVLLWAIRGSVAGWVGPALFGGAVVALTIKHLLLKWLPKAGTRTPGPRQPPE